MGRRGFHWTALVLGLLSSVSLRAAVTFTGNADTDFQPASCIAEFSDKDVGMPNSFPDTEISGWDIRKVCFSYDPLNGQLYIGLLTFTDPSLQKIIFGDADGDGDPAGTSPTLAGLGGVDQSGLGGREYFTLALDINNDNAPDLVAGVYSGVSIASFQVVRGASAPNNDLAVAHTSLFYGGTAIPGVSTTVAFNPSGSRPHLEFLIGNLANLPEFASLDFNNPDDLFNFYVTAGSLDDDGIAEESFPATATWKPMKVGYLTDNDGDTVNDALDTDDDNDGIPDLIEQNLSQYDTDGDGSLSAAEVAASGADTDGDGDLDTNDFGSYPDTDGDGIPDHFDTDSDGDGISDALEGSVDTDGDGVSDYRDLDSDNDGIPDAEEDTNGNGEVNGGETSPIVPDNLPVPAGSSDTADLGGDVDLTRGGATLQAGGCSVLPVTAGGISFLSFWWLLLIAWFGIIPKVWGVNVDHYRSNSDGTGFLNYESVKTVEPRHFNVGWSQHLSRHPLEFGLQSGGQKLDSVVDSFYVWDFWGAVGVWKKVDVSLHLPMSLVTQFEDLTATSSQNKTHFGDLSLAGKWHFLENFGAKTTLLLPTGSEKYFFGESGLAAFVDFLTEWEVRGHTIGGHLGAAFRDKTTVNASNIDLLTVGSEMRWGLGWRWSPVAHPDWSFMSHLFGNTDFLGKVNSPIEWNFGFGRAFEKLPVDLQAGVGVGLSRGYGVPDYRLTLALQYVSDRNRLPLYTQEDLLPELLSDGALPPGAQAKLEGREIVILQPIHFDSGSAILSDPSLPVLSDVAKLLQANQTIKQVRIDGHTDSDGSDPFNLELSTARAQSVRSFLTGQGVDPQRLDFQGWGERQPVLPNNATTSKARNRRVEFHVTQMER